MMTIFGWGSILAYVSSHLSAQIFLINKWWLSLDGEAFLRKFHHIWVHKSSSLTNDHYLWMGKHSCVSFITFESTNLPHWQMMTIFGWGNILGYVSSQLSAQIFLINKWWLSLDGETFLRKFHHIWVHKSSSLTNDDYLWMGKHSCVSFITFECTNLPHSQMMTIIG